MKKNYSAPIADLIETEIDDVMIPTVSVIGQDPYITPGFDVDDLGEAKSGDVFDAGSKSTSIFDYE